MCAMCTLPFHVHIVHIIFSCAQCAHNVRNVHIVHIDMHKMCSKLTLTAVAKPAYLRLTFNL